MDYNANFEEMVAVTDHDNTINQKEEEFYFSCNNKTANYGIKLPLDRPLLLSEIQGEKAYNSSNELMWSAVARDPSVLPTKILLSKLRKGIQPSHLRGKVWKALSQSDSLNLVPLYEQLKNEPSPYEKLILRDVTRTFPDLEMFSDESGQKALERVLRAYSLYDAGVGYCQGLAFLVGPLLLHMSEQDAFCVFVRLMETYNLRILFTTSMEGLHLRLFQFDVFLLEQLPELHSFLSHHGIHSQMYASQWFLTIFAYIFPLPLIYRIYDVMFVEGATETVMCIALSLLKKSMPRILSLVEFEDVIHTISKCLMEPHEEHDFDSVIQDAALFSDIVTSSKLVDLENKYYLLQDTKRNEIQTMDKINSTEENSSASSIKRSKTWFGTAKKTKKRVDTKTGTDQKLLHQQIEDLVSALSQVERDNISLRKQVNDLTQKQALYGADESKALEPKHVYRCLQVPETTIDESTTYKSYCHCELEKQLVEAKIRISDLEATLSEQQEHNKSPLRRTSSTHSTRSSSSFSSLSSITSSPPASFADDYYDISFPENNEYHQPSVSKQDIMLPSSYYYTRKFSSSACK